MKFLTHCLDLELKSGIVSSGFVLGLSDCKSLKCCLSLKVFPLLCLHEHLRKEKENGTLDLVLRWIILRDLIIRSIS
jgi:hypothetical protein